MSQILHNLLANALKFAYPHTCIAVKCHAEDTGLVLQVNNQGNGIPADKMELLFKPYQQITGSYGGAGLGLYICRLYAEAMGGRITVQSEENTATIFTVTIPGCIHPQTIAQDKPANE